MASQKIAGGGDRLADGVGQGFLGHAVIDAQDYSLELVTNGLVTCLGCVRGRRTNLFGECKVRIPGLVGVDQPRITGKASGNTDFL